MPVIEYVPKPKYPIYVEDNIVQYDENVFVWLDETQNAAGVATYLEEAQRQLKEYVKNI